MVFQRHYYICQISSGFFGLVPKASSSNAANASVQHSYTTLAEPYPAAESDRAAIAPAAAEASYPPCATAVNKPSMRLFKTDAAPVPAYYRSDIMALQDFSVVGALFDKCSNDRVDNALNT